MTQPLYLHAHVDDKELENDHRIEEVTIARARFGTITDEEAAPLALTIQLASKHGLAVAVYTELEQVWEFMAALDVEQPEQLVGKQALAHYSARKLIGISPKAH